MGRPRVLSFATIARAVLGAVLACSALVVRADDGRALPASETACLGCHSDIAAEWSGSLHARSFVDPVFRAEWEPAPARACVGCHAPLVPESAAPSGPEAQAGIACTVCHVDARGRVLGATDRRLPHPVVASPGLRDGTTCAGCHEFRFPDAAPGAVHAFDPDVLQQSTVSEWRASGAPRSCVDCHMPRDADGRVTHAFPGASGPMLSRAVDVRVRAVRTRTGTTVEALVRARDVGHALPTGDLFRRLAFVASTSRSTERIELRRYFAARLVRGRFVRTEVDDTRLRPGRPRRIRLRLDAADVDAVRWSLALERLDPSVASARGLSPEVFRVPVAEGTVRLRDARHPAHR